MKSAALLSLLLLCSCSRQHGSLQSRISQIAQTASGTVCVSIENIETGDTLSYNGNVHAPMQSVFKFPVALAVMNLIDKGGLSLEQKIYVSKAEFSDTATMSPMRDKYSGEPTDVSVNEMLHYMVSESDNIACDILLEHAGGPARVTDYIHSLGIKGLVIAATEKEMHVNTSLQYKSWCEAAEMTHLLKLFYEGKCLSPSSTDYLRQIMEGTTTGAKRIKGLLPKGTVVAHKTGTAMTENGLTPATNDAGIISLPNGKHLIVSVFVTDSRANDTIREAVIARIARAAYDNMSNK